MKRRTFLQSASAVAAGSSLLLGNQRANARTPLPLLAQLSNQNNDKILIVIQLFGGNDGLNTIIPAQDDAYHKLRPNIGIAPRDAWNNIGNIYLNAGLAAGGRGGMAQMLEMGTLAIVQGVGYDKPNLSHFRSTDIWLSGINSSDPNVNLDTGWLGRWLEKQYPSFPQSLPDDPLAIQFGGFSLALLSKKGRMGIEVGNPSLQKGLISETDTLDAQSPGTKYEVEYAFVSDIAQRSNKYAARVQEAYSKGKQLLKGSYASDGFASQMSSVAALIAGGLNTRVYVVSLGGFDTHVSQQTTPNSGQHPMLLGRMADAVAQFGYDMQQLDQAGFHVADRVVGMTVSEFGRRPQENGSFGTDHGAASVQFVFGTQVNSAVYGHTPDLSNLDSNQDIPYQIDYREVYTDLLTTWFGMPLADARTVLQDDSLNPLGVIKSQLGTVASPVSTSFEALTNYPNPFRSGTTFKFNLVSDEHVRLTLADIQGREVAVLVDRSLSAGPYEVPLRAELRSGTYICTLRTSGSEITKFIQCAR